MHPTPHDALFKATFTDLKRAEEVLKHALGPEVSKDIDFTTLAIEAGSFVDEGLRERHADILYSVMMRGRRVLIYVLFEHQSKDDPWMPLRLLIYMVRIWEMWLRSDPTPPRLPAILSVVLHHSEKGWRSVTRFEGLIDLPDDTPEAVWALIPKFRFVLDDLSAASAEDLRQRAISAGTRLVLSALQQVRTVADLVALIRGWVDLMHELRSEPDGVRALQLVLRYTAEVRGVDDRTIIDVIATEIGRKEANTMQTIADWWREEGERKGREDGERKGRQEGERALLVRQLRRRFGELPALVLARIEGADEARLERWGEDLLEARSLDELFPMG